jgi:hypothetical protein
MLTYETLVELVGKCKFKDWNITIDKDKISGNRPYLQVKFIDIDHITGLEEMQHCRKWYLSYNMVESEVVRTAHKAVRTAMEHEVDEAFTYDGTRIFNPHMDLLLLAKAAKHIDIR